MRRVKMYLSKAYALVFILASIFLLLYLDTGSAAAQAPSRLSGLSEALINQISEPMEIDETEVEISASIGIAMSPNSHAAGPKQVGEYADIALYAAKRSGRGRHMYWHAGLGNKLSELDLPHIAVR